eukprot:scaffold231703_cov32-Tisochrysis_lutea.AAC.2
MREVAWQLTLVMATSGRCPSARSVSSSSGMGRELFSATSAQAPKESGAGRAHHVGIDQGQGRRRECKGARLACAVENYIPLENGAVRLRRAASAADKTASSLAAVERMRAACHTCSGETEKRSLSTWSGMSTSLRSLARSRSGGRRSTER